MFHIWEVEQMLGSHDFESLQLQINFSIVCPVIFTVIFRYKLFLLETFSRLDGKEIVGNKKLFSFF